MPGTFEGRGLFEAAPLKSHPVPWHAWRSPHYGCWQWGWGWGRASSATEPSGIYGRLMTELNPFGIWLKPFDQDDSSYDKI